MWHACDEDYLVVHLRLTRVKLASFKKYTHVCQVCVELYHRNITSVHYFAYSTCCIEAIVCVIHMIF